MPMGWRTTELSQVWREVSPLMASFHGYHILSLPQVLCSLWQSLSFGLLFIMTFWRNKDLRDVFWVNLWEIYYKVILIRLLIHLNIFSAYYIQDLRSFTENPTVIAMLLITGNLLLAKHLQVMSKERVSLPSSSSLYSLSTSPVAISVLSDD